MKRCSILHEFERFLRGSGARVVVSAIRELESLTFSCAHVDSYCESESVSGLTLSLPIHLGH